MDKTRSRESIRNLSVFVRCDSGRRSIARRAVSNHTVRTPEFVHFRTTWRARHTCVPDFSQASRVSKVRDWIHE